MSMDESKLNFLELLRYADRSYSAREAVDQLIDSGLSDAQATEQIMEALSAGRAVKARGDQLTLSDRERSGW